MTVTSKPSLLRLQIAPLIASAETLATTVKDQLPGHDGLFEAAGYIAQAARNAEAVSRSTRRPLSLHRLPVLFLGVALLILAGWLYGSFFRVSSLSLALPDRDATGLRDALRSNARLEVKVVEVPGSREAAALLERGEVDLGYVQGGVPVSPTLRRAEIPGRELVLLFLKPGVEGLADARVVMTSKEHEGSHSVLKAVCQALALDVPTLKHTWGALTTEAAASVPPDVDAVFVVKDPSDEQTLRGVRRLTAAGYRLADVPLGAAGARLDFLSRQTLEPGWLSPSPPVPQHAIVVWAVQTYLVAREGLTPRLLAQAARLVGPRGVSLAEGAAAPSTEATSEVLQGVDAFLGILINIGLAFLALVGLDVAAYRRQFHELNSLVSLLSALQANKDVLAVKDDALRLENMRYLSLVSDLLGVISQVASYYTQENSALLFNNLSEVIHERCDGLKLNIQLKLLQSAIRS